MPLEGIGKILLIAVIGLLLIFSRYIPFVGNLPGDISIKKDYWSFYFPVVTFLIISILLTIIVNLIFFFLIK